MTSPKSHPDLITKSIEEKCVFCDISKRSGKFVIDIEPLNPVIKGHRIIFSDRHSTDFTDNAAITVEVMNYASEIAKKLGGEWNLITSKGKNATQSVFHLHVHLVPRTENDGLMLPWTGKDLLTAVAKEAEESYLKGYKDGVDWAVEKLKLN